MPAMYFPPVEPESLRQKLLGRTIRGIKTLCYQEYSPAWDAQDPEQNHAELSWGVRFDLGHGEHLVFTWGEDRNHGNPFYLALGEDDQFSHISGLAIQDVSQLSPWKAYTSQTVNHCEILLFPPRPGPGQVSAPWGLILEAGDRHMLIGALMHGTYPQSSEGGEIVVVFGDLAIKRMLRDHDDRRIPVNT